MPKSIGIDVSQDFLDVSSYDGGELKMRHYDSNDTKAFKQILKDFALDTINSLITMEATGVYHLKLAHYFLENGYQVSVVNPLKIKKYAEMKLMRAKTDKTDAKLIAQYGYEQSPTLYQPRPYERENLLLMLKGIEELQASQLQYSNRLYSLAKRVYKPKELITHYQQILRQLNRHIAALEEKISEYIQTFFTREHQLLESIPGVGSKISSVIIAYFCDFTDFENAKQVAAFAGVNPNPRESGKSIKRRGSISKKGHSYLRKMLYMGAVTAKKYNPQCKQLYERLLQQGKPKKLALVAVMNKLLRQIFAVVKQGRPFQAQFAGC